MQVKQAKRESAGASSRTASALDVKGANELTPRDSNSIVPLSRQLDALDGALDGLRTAIPSLRAARDCAPDEAWGRMWSGLLSVGGQLEVKRRVLLDEAGL